MFFSIIFFILSYIVLERVIFLMKSVIPFTKELEFDTKVSEITSISLEREFKLVDDSIEGNLLVTGEYKSHEVSVNILPFSFKIPFSIGISNRAIEDSISLEISDFAYDMVDDNKIKVHIELELDFTEEEIKEVKDESNEIIDMLENDRAVVDIPEIVEESKEEEVLVKNEEVNNEELNEVEEEGLDKEMIVEESVMKNEVKDEYMTYHIHILKEGETLETLCAMYKVTGSFLAEYNDISNLNVGDKILIPFENE